MRWRPLHAELDDGPDFDALAIVESIRRCGSVSEWCGGFESFAAEMPSKPQRRLKSVPWRSSRQVAQSQKEAPKAAYYVALASAERAKEMVLAREAAAREALLERQQNAVRDEARWAGIRAYQENLMREHLAKNARQAP